MLKGVVMQRLTRELYEAISGPPCSSLKGVHHMPGEERSGEDLNCMTRGMKGKGV